MLLISRRSGEGVVINGDIEIKVLEVRGGKVKLGLEYPAGNTVYRQEVFAKIQSENRAAALRTEAGDGAGTSPNAKIGTVLASLKVNPKAGTAEKAAGQPVTANQKDLDSEPASPNANIDDHS